MARFFKAAVFATLALYVADAAVAQNGRPGPPVLTPEQILRRPMVFTTYKWTHTWKGDEPVKGPLTSTHICLLTQLTGKFQGAGERIAVYIDAGATGGARWVISGSSGQNELAGEMTCVARDQFVFGPGLFSTFPGEKLRQPFHRKLLAAHCFDGAAGQEQCLFHLRCLRQI